MAGFKCSTYEILCTRIMDMKTLFLYVSLGLILCNTGFARSTGCTEGDCDNGNGTWTYTDLTTYVGEWRNGKKHGKGTVLGQTDTYTWESFEIVNGMDKEL